MDVEKMSNEELADKLEIGEWTDVIYGEMQAEIANRLRTSMHWLPMTPDAVFEDGGAYLVESVHDGLLFAVEYGGYDAKFHLPLDVIEPFSAKDITHYARITEPK